MENNEKSSVEVRQENKKEQLIEILKKTPIIQIACEKAEVGRATYYRWRKDDPEFASATEEAISSGSGRVSDLAESQLISAIREQNLTAIMFWLKNHHPKYATRLEVTANLHTTELLTSEQQELVERALKLAAVVNPKDSAKNIDEQK